MLTIASSELAQQTFTCLGSYMLTILCSELAEKTVTCSKSTRTRSCLWSKITVKTPQRRPLFECFYWLWTGNLQPGEYPLW